MARGLTLFTARWLVVDAERVLENAGLLVRGGKVVDVCSQRGRAPGGARTLALGDLVLAPGLVNAHAHLELSDLAGTLPCGPDFTAWLAALVAARRAWTFGQIARSARRGADLLLDSGCTAVGDIDSGGAALRALARHDLRAVVYREWLDLGDPARLRAALGALAGRAVGRRRRGLVEGLSPHAPYTVGPELLAALARRSERNRAPLAMHWAETREEGDWLERGEGPFAELFPGSPRAPGLDRIEAAGLLGPRLALIHGNDPRRDEIERIAASRAVLVHCPGSHAWFERAPFPLEAYRRAGVPLALGTDSLASNGALDMRREMALARQAFPDVEPREVWRWATEGGARALGLGGRIGVLRPGAQADLVAFVASSARAPELWDELTAGSPALAGVWIGGRPVRGEGSADRSGRARRGAHPAARR